MKYVPIALLFCLLLSGCPTTEPAAGFGADSGDAGSADVRARPDLERDSSPIDRSEPDAGSSDLGGDVSDGDVGGTNQPPVARAVERIDARVGDTVTFDGSASSDPDGDVLGWEWDFGDGATGDGAIATHVYELAGVYTAELTVEDDQGATDTTALEVRILTGMNQPPNAVITMPSLPVPVGQAVAFEALASSDPDGRIAAYNWEFRVAATGEGVGIANGTTATFAFEAVGEYEVRLQITDNQGAVASAVETVPVVAAPVADFTVTPDPAAVDAPASFDGSGSTPADSPIVSWDWDFGDEATASGESVAHAYTVAGSYDVTLTVTDNDGMSGSLTRSLTVTPPANAPTVNAGGDLVGLVGESIAFSATATDSDGTVVGWLWDFGDGATGAGSTADHSYTAVGTYTVTLTVTDNDGNAGTDSIEVIVHRAPVAVIDVLTPVPTAGAAVSLSGLSSSDPDGDPIAAYFWTLGDGVTSTAAEPSHTYVSGGSYEIGLTVTDPLGATGSVTTTLSVACDGDCGATGLWRVRPFDSEDGAEGDCNALIVITVGPANCEMTESGVSLQMDCGGGFVYSGTRTGDAFSLTLPSATVAGDDLVCGDAYFSETITGTFVSTDRWEGTSDLSVAFELWDPFFCYDCAFEPFPKTGERQ